MRILVTGSNGFIGQELCKVLENTWPKAYDVYKIDRGIGKDIRDCDFPKHIDTVIHLAARAGVRESIKNPKEYWEVNVDGTRRVLEAYPNARVLVASSSSAYEPWRNPYAATKYVAESIPHDNCTHMRFHTVYGPVPRKGMFFDLLLNNKLKYVTTHERDFVHVDDLVQAIIKLIPCKMKRIDIGTGQTIRPFDLRPDLPVRPGESTERLKTRAYFGDVDYLTNRLGCTFRSVQEFMNGV